jgi:hypothetical protein
MEITDPRETIKIEIKSGNVDVKAELPRQTAIQFVEAILKSNPENEWLQENLKRCMQSFGFMGTSYAGNIINISGRLPRIELPEKMTCRDRMEQIGTWERKENLDHWNLVGDDKVCSFCGSMHPDRVLELVKSLGIQILEASTKSYKIYIHRANIPNAEYGGIKYYRWHDTPEFITEMNTLIEKGKENG